MKRFAGAVVVIATALAGCEAPNTYCLRPARYLDAETLPPLQAPEGLTVPQSPGALVIPPPPAAYIPFGRKLPDPKAKNGERVDCLDQPPVMPLANLPTPSVPANATPMSAAPPSESPTPPSKPASGPNPPP